MASNWSIAASYVVLKIYKNNFDSQKTFQGEIGLKYNFLNLIVSFYDFQLKNNGFLLIFFNNT